MPRERRTIFAWIVAGLWIITAVILLLVDLGSESFKLGWIAFTYLLLVLITSVLGFFAYGWDKRQAQTSRWRVREKTLHLWSLLGGWPGCLIAQHVFRHKTRKVSFQIVFWVTVLLHVAVVGWWILAD